MASGSSETSRTGQCSPPKTPVWRRLPPPLPPGAPPGNPPLPPGAPPRSGPPRAAFTSPVASTTRPPLITNVGWSAPQIMNLDFPKPGILGRQQPPQNRRRHMGYEIGYDTPSVPFSPVQLPTPRGMVIGSGDRALGRKVRVESIRRPFGIPARDFAPKPHAHDPVAMPCVGMPCQPQPHLNLDLNGHTSHYQKENTVRNIYKG